MTFLGAGGEEYKNEEYFINCHTVWRFGCGGVGYATRQWIRKAAHLE
jgi:hypothetical protein